ncbi:MAG TPA: TIM-barrel domain-containing protein, partial [Rhizomicrobium sp.]|nr:TIM-barrel domain-containing protein [Rhizomicrobium sp.]
MGLGLALSGVSNSGHDVGGFDGPRPDAELFVRWVGFGIFLPRFSIHSWNADRTANEPWMHPEVTPAVRDLIKFRYRLLPHLYDLMVRHAQHYEPIARPTFYDFPDDPRCFEENDDMLLGEALLVAALVEQGAVTRDVYLPKGTHWFDWWTGEALEGGQVVTRPAPYDRPPLFAREGSVIALNVAEQHFAKRADKRAFAVFPVAQGTFTAEIADGDGESVAVADRIWRIRVRCDTNVIEVVGADDSEIILPAGETRRLIVPR